jgi:hypothetical protein
MSSFAILTGARRAFHVLRRWLRQAPIRSASLARESRDDLTIVVTFALLGLSLSLLAIESGLIDPEYMADLLLLF